jgi:hypothetical protein
LNVIQKKFCVLQKKVLSFGPNRTVEVRLNGSAELKVRSVTRRQAAGRLPILATSQAELAFLDPVGLSFLRS